MDNKKNIKHINSKLAPEPTLKRMPVYLLYLKKVISNNNGYISAPQMAAHFGYEPTQIVKDLAYTGVKGKPRVGYNIGELILTIENYLGFNNSNEAFLVGVGKLGQALLSYHELQGFGVKIIAAFDVDKTKIDTVYKHINILPVDKLGELAKRLGVSIGILTTPANVAQVVAEALVKSGITAIWNLTSVKLKLPNNVIVQETMMYADVAVLLKKVNDNCFNK